MSISPLYLSSHNFLPSVQGCSAERQRRPFWLMCAAKRLNIAHTCTFANQENHTIYSIQPKPPTHITHFFFATHTLTDTHTSTCTCNLTSSPEGSRMSISNKQRFHNRHICRNIHHIVLLRLPQAKPCPHSAGFSERGSKICRVCRLGAKLCKQITRGARQVFGC